MFRTKKEEYFIGPIRSYGEEEDPFIRNESLKKKNIASWVTNPSGKILIPTSIFDLLGKKKVPLSKMFFFGKIEDPWIKWFYYRRQWLDVKQNWWSQKKEIFSNKWNNNLIWQIRILLCYQICCFFHCQHLYHYFCC